MNGQKQLVFLFSSLAKVSGDWQLSIVDSGEEHEINQVKQLAKKLNIEKKLTGMAGSQLFGLYG